MPFFRVFSGEWNWLHSGRHCISFKRLIWTYPRMKGMVLCSVAALKGQWRKFSYNVSIGNTCPLSHVCLTSQNGHMELNMRGLLVRREHILIMSMVSFTLSITETSAGIPAGFSDLSRCMWRQIFYFVLIYMFVRLIIMLTVFLCGVLPRRRLSVGWLPGKSRVDAATRLNIRLSVFFLNGLK